MTIASLMVKDVRCFKGEHTLEVAPLTILLGENSTGKSSLLALYRLVWDSIYGNQMNFNEPPFSLGAYDDLAYYHGGQAARAQSFTIGGCIDSSRTKGSRRDTKPVSIYSTYISKHGVPVLSKARVEFDETTATVTRDSGTITMRIVSPNFERSHEMKIRSLGEVSTLDLLRFASYRYEDSLRTSLSQETTTDEKHRPDSTFIRYLHNELLIPWVRQHSSSRPIAVAPIRTQPKRIYEYLSDSSSPEGAHVPNLLSRLQSSDQEAWNALRETLREYGMNSGLFSDLTISRYKRPVGNPFQILLSLKNQKKPVSLADVGYGVSQVLPLLVDLLTNRGSTILLQQPEVHLHPKAQAALGTFLAALVGRKLCQIVLETHSDYILNRVRIAIREKAIQPHQVRIYFFSRDERGSHFDQIELDEHANITSAPDQYRRFFNDESMRILGL